MNSDDAPVNRPLAERLAAVQAQVVEGVKQVAQPEHRHVAAADNHHRAGARSEVGDLADADKFTS